MQAPFDTERVLKMKMISIVSAATACVFASTVASQACILLGMVDQGGNCAAHCEAHGDPYWLCMVGSPAPQNLTQGESDPSEPVQR